MDEQIPSLSSGVLFYHGLILNAEGTDSTAVANYIANLKDFPVSAGKLTYDPKTHNLVHKPAVLETIKGGKFVLLRRFKVSNEPNRGLFQLGNLKIRNGHTAPPL